jgi:hypothetical protein
MKISSPAIQTMMSTPEGLKKPTRNQSSSVKDNDEIIASLQSYLRLSLLRNASVQMVEVARQARLTRSSLLAMIQLLAKDPDLIQIEKTYGSPIEDLVPKSGLSGDEFMIIRITDAGKIPLGECEVESLLQDAYFHPNESPRYFALEQKGARRGQTDIYLPVQIRSSEAM